MATLEKQESTTTTTTATTAVSAPAGPIPTPFTNPLQDSERRESRSPSASRGVSGLLGKVRNAISRSRDRSGSNSGERPGIGGRRLSVGGSPNVGEERGRSGERREANIAEEEVSSPPRNRTLSPSGIKFSALVPTRTTNTTYTTDTQRGRQAFVSSGRGGAGNMKTSIGSAVVDENQKDIEAARSESKARSRSRGREEVIVGGRGGRGNIKSPERGEDLEASRKQKVEEDKKEEAAVLEQKRVREAAAPKVFVSGRGGAGNIAVSRPNGVSPARAS